MSELTIITNNVPRDILDAFELTQEEMDQFDYISWEKVQNGEDSASFFRYKGEIYDLNEFSVPQACQLVEQFKEWHGYQSDSFFSGILVRYTDDSEQVIVGRYYS